MPLISPLMTVPQGMGRSTNFKPQRSPCTDNGTRNTCIADMCNDLQVAISEWLFKSPLAGWGHIVEAPL